MGHLIKTWDMNGTTIATIPKVVKDTLNITSGDTIEIEIQKVHKKSQHQKNPRDESTESPKKPSELNKSPPTPHDNKGNRLVTITPKT